MFNKTRIFKIKSKFILQDFSILRNHKLPFNTGTTYILQSNIYLKHIYYNSVVTIEIFSLLTCIAPCTAALAQKQIPHDEWSTILANTYFQML